jgi:hypothetical protein
MSALELWSWTDHYRRAKGEAWYDSTYGPSGADIAKVIMVVILAGMAGRLIYLYWSEREDAAQQ